MRKGQITMFIIVGIALLLAIGLGVVAWKIINEQAPPEDQNKKETNVELKPLNDLIDRCLESTSRNVFEQIGLHGGYYDPQSVGYIANPIQPIGGNAFEPFPGQTVPYWSYLASPPACTECLLGSEQPPLNGSLYPAIQAQASIAIQKQLSTCINDFAGLENRYVIKNKSSPVVGVFFGNDNVVIRLQYQLEVQTESKSVTTLKDFSTSIDVPFQKMYTYASQIRDAQERMHFFEGLAIETISRESSLNITKFPPPYGGTQFTYDPGPIWVLQSVKKTLAESLAQDVNIVQLLGSTGMDFVHTGDSLTDNQYANYYFSIEDSAPQVTAQFVYLPNWQPYVSIHPGGQLIKPDMFSVGLPFLPPVKRLDYQYDVSYPVLVQLRTPTKNGQYLFQFPIEANMRKNNPIEYSTTPLQQPSPSYCDPELAAGTIANVSVLDDQGNPLETEVTYSCLANTCQLGTSRQGKLVSQLPSCIGGSIEASKDGYKTANQSMDSTTGKQDVSLTLQHFTDVTITPKMFYIKKSVQQEGMIIRSVWVKSQNSYDIQDPDEMILIMTPRDDDTQAQVLQFPSTEPQIAKLYPGTYDVSAILLQKLSQPKVIHGNPNYCRGGTIITSDTCVSIPDVTFGGGSGDSEDKMYVGGLQWDETTKNITLTQEMLDAGTFTIPVLEVYLPDVQNVINSDDTSDLEALDKVTEFSAQLDIS